jgi:thiamine biosynthesis lipoprotein
VIADDFPAMGTTVSVTAASASNIVATRTWFEEVEQVCSRFRPDSDLTLANEATAERVAVSSMLAEILERAAVLRVLTDGLVDPAVGGDVIRWGYDRTFEEVGDRNQCVEADPCRQAWRVECQWLTRSAGLRLDLGGLAKGWAADRAVEQGLALIVSAGGDIRSRHPKTAVEVLGPDDEIAATVLLGCGALATSSVARRRWRVADGIAHHLIDPRTGAPAAGPIVSATVVAATAIEAEAGAKAMMLHGVDGLAWVAAQPWLEGGLAVWADGSVYATADVEVAA